MTEQDLNISTNDDLRTVDGTRSLDDPRLYEGVRTGRSIAFLIDYTIVLLLLIPAFFLIGIAGILTFGLGWMLYPFIGLLVAVPYVAFTLGGAQQATPGMRMMGVKLLREDGKTVDPPLAALHSILFWAGNAVVSPLILLSTLFLNRKKTVHDLLLGTVVVKSRYL